MPRVRSDSILPSPRHATHLAQSSVTGHSQHTPRIVRPSSNLLPRRTLGARHRPPQSRLLRVPRTRRALGSSPTGRSPDCSPKSRSMTVRAKSSPIGSRYPLSRVTTVDPCDWNLPLPPSHYQTISPITSNTPCSCTSFIHITLLSSFPPLAAIHSFVSRDVHVMCWHATVETLHCPS